LAERKWRGRGAERGKERIGDCQALKAGRALLAQRERAGGRSGNGGKEERETPWPGRSQDQGGKTYRRRESGHMDVERETTSMAHVYGDGDMAASWF
jgi:hypothetical protein